MCVVGAVACGGNNKLHGPHQKEWNWRDHLTVVANISCVEPDPPVKCHPCVSAGDACRNGGECRGCSGGSEFSCTCLPWWKGLTCEEEVDLVGRYKKDDALKRLAPDIDAFRQECLGRIWKNIISLRPSIGKIFERKEPFGEQRDRLAEVSAIANGLAERLSTSGCLLNPKVPDAKLVEWQQNYVLAIQTMQNARMYYQQKDNLEAELILVRDNIDQLLRRNQSQ